MTSRRGFDSFRWVIVGFVLEIADVCSGLVEFIRQNG
jgi:hypothetical protein